MMVDRCVCAGQTFVELLQIQRAHQLTFRELVDRTGACRGCNLCEPYVRATITTGRTEHPVTTRPPAC
jgi:bacterioferritin-associated ferredoxin